MRVVVLLAVSVAAVAAAPELGARRSVGGTVIQASAKFQRLGDWRIDRTPTLSGAIQSLGEPSSCRAPGKGHSVARWESLGVAVDLWTFGLLPPGRTGCTAPELISVNYVRVTGKRWLTSLGLRVGDSQAKLRRLYPHAARNPRGSWPRPSAYWLVTRRTRCLGVCETSYVSVPQLLAEVSGTRVVAFFFHVGAQGE